MAKPDVVLLTAIASHIITWKQTTIGTIADVFNLSAEDAIEAVKILFLTEVDDRAARYFVDFELDAATTDDDTDLVYSLEDTISYVPMLDDDPRVYLTYGEAAVSIEIIDQLLKLVDPASEAGLSLRSVREKIRRGTGDIVGAAPPEPRGSQDVLDAVWEAMRESRRLTFTYHRADGVTEAISTRTVIPCAVVSEQEGYLAALQNDRDLRWFRLDRMSRASTGAPVSQTEANRARRTLRRHPHLHPTTGTDVTFTVKPGAAWFAEAIPGAVTVNGGDTLSITVHAVSATWVRECAIKIGTDLVDIAPVEMKRDVIAQATAIAQVQR